MKTTIIALSFLVLLLAPFAFGEEMIGYAGENTTIVTACIRNAQLRNNATANITIYDDNNNIIIPNTIMTPSGDGTFYHTVILNNGSFITKEVCNFGDYNGDASTTLTINNRVDMTNYTLINNSINNAALSINNNIFILNNTINSIQNDTTILKSNATTAINLLHSISNDVSNIKDDTTDLLVYVKEINITTHNIDANLNLTEIENNLALLISKCNNLTNLIIGVENDLAAQTNTVNNINSSTTYINASIPGIQQNLTAIYEEVIAINANITAQNLTAINDSITGLIISENAKPRTYTTEMLFLVIFVVLIIATMFINAPIFSIVTGIYGVIYGLILIGTMGFWFGIIIMGLGAAFAIYGMSKAGYF